MCTGHPDNYGARRLDLPNTPRSWQSGGMLTNSGWDGLMQFAHGFKMGMAGTEIGGDLQHLIAYPGIVEPTIDNLSGTWLRKVTHLKVLQYTDKAPEWDGGVLG